MSLILAQKTRPLLVSAMPQKWVSIIIKSCTYQTRKKATWTWKRKTLEKHWAGKEWEGLEGSLVEVGILEEARAAWEAMAWLQSWGYNIIHSLTFCFTYNWIRIIVIFIFPLVVLHFWWQCVKTNMWWEWNSKIYEIR